jgi:hypothetical protein
MRWFGVSSPYPSVIVVQRNRYTSCESTILFTSSASDFLGGGGNWVKNPCKFVFAKTGSVLGVPPPPFLLLLLVGESPIRRGFHHPHENNILVPTNAAHRVDSAHTIAYNL